MALSSPEIERMIQEATTAMQRGDLPAAHAVAERGIAAGVEHPVLLTIEGLWLHNDGRYQDALRTFHHARTLAPNDPSILNGIAGCLAGMGEYGPALTIIEAALELAPDASQSHYLRGWILEAARDFAAARTSYERAVSLSPSHVQALAGLASVAVQLQDFAAAHQRAAQALALDPRQPTATLALAMMEIQQGEASAAETRLRGLLSSERSIRTRVLAWGALANALDIQGRTTEALNARKERDKEIREATPAAAGLGGPGD